MSGWWKAVREKLQGRKTYLVGGALIALALAGAWTGKLSAGTALLIGSYGLGVIPIAAKSNRNHKQLMCALELAGAAGLAARTGGLAAVAAVAKQELPQIAAAFGSDAGSDQGAHDPA